MNRKRQSLRNKINYTLYFLKEFIFSVKYRRLRMMHIADNEQTVRRLVSERCSISRFGDGEFSLLAGYNTDFQKSNPRVVRILREILTLNDDKFMVGIPYVWKNLFPLKYRAFEYWSSYLTNNLETRVLPFINGDKQYYDAYFTRFYIDYRSTRNARRILPLIRQIWDGRDICIIEGEFSRLGVGNDLFANARSIKRILCPATNAFDLYDSIIEEAKRLPQDTLLLIALGMTATCLAYDLYKGGYQAVDIGHVDVEYEWFRMGAKEKVPIRGKYVAESNAAAPIAKVDDNSYLSQVIAKIDV